MTRFPVESSNIAAIGYDPSTRTLEVQFHPNRYGMASVWQYSPVDAAIYEQMRTPLASVGRLFHEYVKTRSDVTAQKVDEIYPVASS